MVMRCFQVCRLKRARSRKKWLAISSALHGRHISINSTLSQNTSDKEIYIGMYLKPDPFEKPIPV